VAPEERAERGSWVGCIAGALSVGEYREHLEAAGFVETEIRLTHEVAPGMHAAIIRARTPMT
jgi:arsenite methyltransferase